MKNMFIDIQHLYKQLRNLYCHLYNIFILFFYYDFIQYIHTLTILLEDFVNF